MISKTSLNIEINAVKLAQSKPAKHRLQVQYPIDGLSSEHFELLIYCLFTETESKKLLSVCYDDTSMIVGAGDKGRDVILLKNNTCVGVVQCKKYKDPLTKPMVAREVIKFALHVLQDNNLAPDKENFVYSISAVNGFNIAATELLDSFSRQIADEADFRSWINAVINENVSITADPVKCIPQLLDLFKGWKFAKVLPIDLSNRLDRLPSVATSFFAMHSVIDKATFEEIVRNRNININKFKEDYANSVLNNYSRVNFFGLSLSRKPREIPLEDLFVVPKLNVISGLSDFTHASTTFLSLYPSLSERAMAVLMDRYFFTIRENPILGLSKLFNSKKGIVVLGRPGAGKTSIIKYSIIKLLKQEHGVFDNKDIYESFPLRVELHKYNKFKRISTGGFIGYVANNLQDEFQISYVSPGSIEKIFEEFKMVVFFDGLDEIFDAHERIAVRNDIENFDKKFEHTLSIVTSRYESYKEVAMSSQRFNVCEVMDFTQDQITEYVKRWYAAEELKENVRDEEISGCLAELEKVDPELKTNPLLLSLILILYRNELQLPTSKWQIYEGCTNTLVEVRDTKEKKLDFGTMVRNKIATFSSLAFWLFNRQTSDPDSIVSFDDIRHYIKSYLLEKKEFDDDNAANLAALDFLDFATLRSIFVENSFTHKTFLEYFTAYFIYTNYYLKARFHEVENLLSKTIGDPSWSVVIELLLCKIDQEQPDFEIIDHLLDLILIPSKKGSLDIILQVIKYLANISPTMQKKAMKQAVVFCLAYGPEEKIKENRIVNQNVMDLVKLERFGCMLADTITELASSCAGDQLVSLAHFHFENEMSVPQYKELAIIAPQLQDIEEPYLYILKNIPSLQTREEYYQKLSLFIEKFGKAAAVSTYQTRFTGVINDYTHFNWCTTFLFSSKSPKEFRINLEHLKSLDIHLADVNHIVKSKSVAINLEESILQDLIRSTKNAPLRKMLERIRLAKFGGDFKTEDVPYYKTFDKRKKNKW